MKFIERYVHEVGRQLPRRLREDVERELLSTLEDAVEARGREKPDADRESLELEVLRDLGPPEGMAASYRPGKPYLIGPGLYHGFLLTMKLCLGILAGIFVLGWILREGDAAGTWPAWGVRVALSLGILMEEAVSVLGWVVLIFAFIERASPDRTSAARPWDPRTLPKVADPDRIHPGGWIAAAAIWTLLLILLNLFPGRFGAPVSMDGGMEFVPILGPGFTRLLPLLDLYLIAGVGLSLFLVRRRRWSPATRWADFGLQALLVVFFARLRTADQVFLSEAERLVARGVGSEFARRYEEAVGPILGPLVRIAVLVALIAAFAALVHKLVLGVRASRSGTVSR